jgi:hypothetical protein
MTNLDQRHRLALGSVEGAAPNTDEGQRKPRSLEPGLKVGERSDLEEK